MAKDTSKRKTQRPGPEPRDPDAQSQEAEAAQAEELHPLEDLARQAQETVLAGARGLQQAYRSVIRSPLLRDTRSQLKDPKHAVVGAGFGAGVGLGLSLLLRAHPVGRAIMVVAGAGCGALIATRDQSVDKKTAKSETADKDKGELV